jgi:hypothetical protein
MRKGSHFRRQRLQPTFPGRPGRPGVPAHGIACREPNNTCTYLGVGSRWWPLSPQALALHKSLVTWFLQPCLTLKSASGKGKAILGTPGPSSLWPLRVLTQRARRGPQNTCPAPVADDVSGLFRVTQLIGREAGLLLDTSVRWFVPGVLDRWGWEATWGLVPALG